MMKLFTLFFFGDHETKKRVHTKTGVDYISMKKIKWFWVSKESQVILFLH